MYESAFQQVCYFFYICVVKFDNKTLNKDECIAMITQKMTVIKQEFTGKVDKQKIMFLLKDLNLLKVFITSPTNLIKDITRDLKATFGSNFSELNLKNLISLRTNVLKQKQFLFQQCRQQMKNSYNSNQQMQSIQRESFFNSSYRRDRKSTLTESLQSYCIDKYDKSKNKIQRNFNFGFQKIIKEGYIYRKRVIKNINTSFTKYFYRLIKGKLYQYDSQQTQDYLNLYQLNQLKKCYIQPQKNDCINLEFDKQIMKLKMLNYEQAILWIQRILQAVEQNKSSFCEFKQNQSEEGVLFEDFSKKKTLETKETQQMSSASKNSRRKNNQMSSVSPNITQNKKTPHKTCNNQRNDEKSKQKYNNKFNKKSHKKLTKQQNNKKSQNGCGASCNFL